VNEKATLFVEQKSARMNNPHNSIPKNHQKIIKLSNKNEIIRGTVVPLEKFKSTFISEEILPVER
jgi:hypothetical protein